ncbi:MAG: hypothetical protein ACRC1H_01210, partial [Caldilineaceae bacterium]
MIAAPTLLYAAHGWRGDVRAWDEAVPVDGLRGGRINRTFFDASKDSLADLMRVIDAHADMGMTLIVCVVRVPMMKPTADLLQALKAPHVVPQWGNEPDSPPHSWPASGYELGLRMREFLPWVPGQVVLGAVQSIAPSGHGLQTLHEALHALGEPRQMLRAVAIHVYTDATKIDMIGRCVDQVRGVLRGFGIGDMPIWCTEFGGPGSARWTERETINHDAGVLRALSRAGVAVALKWAADDPAEFGTDDRAKLRRMWNEAHRRAG